MRFTEPTTEQKNSAGLYEANYFKILNPNAGSLGFPALVNEEKAVSTTQETSLGALLEQVRTEISKCQNAAARYRKADFWLHIGNVVCGSFAAVMAGGTAAAGSSMANQVGGWSVVCAIVAGLTAVATICSSAHKCLKVSERLSDALECAAKLVNLKFDLETNGKKIGEAVVAFKAIIQWHSSTLVG